MTSNKVVREVSFDTSPLDSVAEHYQPETSTASSNSGEQPTMISEHEQLLINNAEIAVVQRMEQSPDWPLLYPRVYPPSADYASPTLSAIWLGNTLKVSLARRRGTNVPKETPDLENAQILEEVLASTLIAHDVPTFWIEPALSLTLAQITPSSSQWFNGPLHLESAILMIPKGTLLHSERGYVDWIAYNRVRDTFTVLAGSGNRSNPFIFPLSERADYDPQLLIDLAAASLEKPKLTIGIWNYLRNALAIMASRPELIHPGVCTRRATANSIAESQECWTRTIVGGELKQ